MRGAFTAVVMLIVSSQTAMAQQDSLSGASALDGCRSLVETDNPAMYEYFARGICSATAGAVFYLLADKTFCPPQDVRNRQTWRTLNLYLQRNPRDQHLHLAELAERAFKEAWPCPAQPQRR